MARTYVEMRLDLCYDVEAEVAKNPDGEGKCIVLKSNRKVVLPFKSKDGVCGFSITSRYQIAGTNLTRRLLRPDFINLEVGSDYLVTFKAHVMRLSEELTSQEMPHVEGYNNVDHLRFGLEDKIGSPRDEIFRQLRAHEIEPDPRKLDLWLTMQTPQHSGD